MKLAQQQDFLARLLTDGDFAARWTEAPEEMAEEMGWNREEAHIFMEKYADRIALFRQTLLRKRWKQFLGLVPHGHGLIGNEDLKNSFFDYANHHPIPNPGIYTSDAIAFLEWWKVQGGDWRVEIMRFEVLREENWRSGKRLQIIRFPFDVRKWLHPPANEAPVSRKVAYLFWKWGDKRGLLRLF